MTIRVVADDLTGALDSAAPLAALAGALPVFWRDHAGSGSFALDTDSRDAPAVSASWLEALRGGDLAYKKVDSLLRGNTAREIAACLETGWFQSAVIAPAFPAQQRITAGGQQYWRRDATQAWQAVACDLGAELRARGIGLRLARSAAEMQGSGFYLADAAAEGDLRGLVAAGWRLAPPVLWCGSAGLARALADTPAKSAMLRLEPPLLLVIGSHHPVTLAQVRALADQAPEIVVETRPDRQIDLRPAIGAVSAALARHRRAALVLATADGIGAAVAGPIFDRVLGTLIAGVARPRSLVVTGGATLHRLVSVLEADCLLVEGESLPGVPRSRIQGGRWEGVEVISKSGAFGERGLLLRLAGRAQGYTP